MMTYVDVESSKVIKKNAGSPDYFIPVEIKIPQRDPCIYNYSDTYYCTVTPQLP